MKRSEFGMMGEEHLVRTSFLLCVILDRHHSTLEASSGATPTPFDRFDGYNVPELSKHRKRKASNLSSTILQKHVSCLRHILLSSWIQLSKWSELKESISKLAFLIDDYCLYLKQLLIVVMLLQKKLIF